MLSCESHHGPLALIRQSASLPFLTIVLVGLIALASTTPSAADHKGNPHGNSGGDPPPPPPPEISYTIEFLAWPGGRHSITYGMNLLGDVVGAAQDVSGEYRPFLYKPSIGMIDLTSRLDPASAWTGFFLRDVNDAGQMVGRATRNGSGEWEPVRLTLPDDNAPLVIEHLGNLGGVEGTAWSINNTGQITGEALDAGGFTRGFLYTDNDGMIDIGDLGGGYSANARAINAAGQVAGTALTPGGFSHAIRYTPADVNGAGQTVPPVIEDLGNLTSRQYEGFPSFGFDISDNGNVVGFAYGDKKVQGWTLYHAALSRPGEVMLDLGTVGDGNWSQAFGINNDDMVVGQSDVESTQGGFAGGLPGEFHAFVWSEDFGMIGLEDLVTNMPATFDGRLKEANKINDAGQIIGRAVYADNLQQAFLLTPVPSTGGIVVPEPTSAVLGLLALTSFGLFRRDSGPLVGCVASDGQHLTSVFARISRKHEFEVIPCHDLHPLS